MEIKPIKDFENYSVSEYGDILKGDRVLKTHLNIDGYLVINLWRNSKAYHKRVNRLVAEVFVVNGNPKEFKVVDHLDMDILNNHYTNLEWVTSKENTRRSIEKRPETWKARAKIDKQDAINICEELQKGLRNKEVSDKLGVTIDTVKHIRRGKTWTEVSCDYTIPKSKLKIGEDTCRWICRKIVEGYQNKEIADMANNPDVSRSLIKAIRAKKTWGWLSVDYF